MKERSGGSAKVRDERADRRHRRGTEREWKQGVAGWLTSRSF